jgi:hypothetical protein
MQPEYVRRNPNGSIDYDFYRRRAARLRRESLRANIKAAAGLIRPAVAAALLTFTLLAMPTRGPRGRRPDRGCRCDADQRRVQGELIA